MAAQTQALHGKYEENSQLRVDKLRDDARTVRIRKRSLFRSLGCAGFHFMISF